MAAGWLWILGFRVAGELAEIDAGLRSEVVPRLREVAGLTASFVGRRSTDSDWDHVIAAAITDAPAAAAVDATIRQWLCDRWPLEGSAVRTKLSRVATSLWFPRDEPARILRIFNGEVRDGSLDSYVAAATRGTRQDAARGHGPVALVLGTDGATRFTTVSAWSDWANIEIATGGDITRPVATKRHESLIGGRAEHYELIVEPDLPPVEDADPVPMGHSG
jgi:hypothetical protein